ncbi:MAG: hypothetical protein K6F99_07660, partial [Lachnospiraceae bacterium]|nr:hypothetical protein [Lachnospiraceae bacterium]
KEEFLLGNVAPDSVHFREDYSIEQKIHTHLFEGCGKWGDTSDYERWIENIKAFWNKYSEGAPDRKGLLYISGICAHCLTDYCNDLYVWRDLQKKNIPPLTKEEFSKAFANEYKLADRWLYENIHEAESILGLLKASKDTELPGYIYSKDIRKLKEHLINVQYNRKENVRVSDFKYYTSDRLMEFTDFVTDKLAGPGGSFIGTFIK